MNEIGAIKYRLEQGYTMTRYGSHRAMIEQLITDTEYLLSKVENNEVLDLVILSDQEKTEQYDKGFSHGYTAGSIDIMESSI